MEDISTGMIVAIVALIVVQLALQVAALISLSKTPTERVTLGGKKWLWAIIILLGEMIGALVWFIAGRAPVAVAEPTVAAPVADRATAAADALYGAPTAPVPPSAPVQAPMAPEASPAPSADDAAAQGDAAGEQR